MTIFNNINGFSLYRGLFCPRPCIIGLNVWENCQNLNFMKSKDLIDHNIPQSLISLLLHYYNAYIKVNTILLIIYVCVFSDFSYFLRQFAIWRLVFIGPKNIFRPGPVFEDNIFLKLHTLGYTKIIVRNCYGGVLEGPPWLPD